MCKKKWLYFFRYHHHDFELGRKRARICDLHFTEDCFEMDLRSELIHNLPKMKFKKDAVPTIYKPSKKKKKHDMKEAERKAIVANILKEHEETRPQNMFNHQDFIKEEECESGMNENKIQSESEMFEPHIEFLEISCEGESEKLFRDSSVQCDLLEELWEESVKNNKESNIYKCLNDFLDMIGKPRRTSFYDIGKFETKTEYEPIMLEKQYNELDTIIMQEDTEYENLDYSIVANTEFKNINKIEITENGTESETIKCEENEYDTKLELDEYEDIEYDESFLSEQMIIKERSIQNKSLKAQNNSNEESSEDDEEEFNSHFVVTQKIIDYEDICINRGDGYFQCKTCNKIVQCRSAIIAHSAVHSEQSLLCPICGIILKKHKNLGPHMRSCRKTDFITEEEAIGSEKKIKTKFSLICEVCDKLTRSRSNFYDHMNSHTKEKPYQCSCGTKFGHVGNFRTHLLNMEKRNELCPIEGRIIPSYATRKTLELLLTNPPEKKIVGTSQKIQNQNDVGSKQMVRQTGLLTSKATTSDEIFLRNFKCPVCNRGFTNKRAVRDHRRRTHLEKKFQCEICAQKFTIACDLKLHFINIHSLQKKCGHCNQIFDYSGYYTHMRYLQTNGIKIPVENQIKEI